MEKEAKRLFIIFWVVIIVETILLSWLFFQRVQESKEKIALKLELKQAANTLSDKETELKDLRNQITTLEDSRRGLETQVKNLLASQKVSEGEARGTKEATQLLAQQFQRQHEDLLKQLSSITSENRESQLSLVSKIESILDAKHKLEIELVSMSKRQDLAAPTLQSTGREGISLGKILVEQKPLPQSTVLEGKILSVDTQYDFVIIDLGKNSGVKTKDRFYVIRRERWIGEIEIEEVYKNMSLANIVSDKTVRNLRRNDKVVPAQ